MFVSCDAILPDISEVQAETSVDHGTKKPCCCSSVYESLHVFLESTLHTIPWMKGEGACFLTTQICPTLDRLPNCFTICLFMGGRACTDVCVCACVFFPGFPVFVWELSWTDIIKRRNNTPAIQMLLSKQEATQMKKKDSALTPFVGRHKNGHLCFFFLGIVKHNEKHEQVIWYDMMILCCSVGCTKLY